MKIDLDFNYYPFIKLVTQDKGYSSLEEMFSAFEDFSSSKGINLNVDLTSSIIEDFKLKSGLPYDEKALFPLIFNAVKSLTFEISDFFGGKIPFILSRDFFTNIHQIKNELNLTQDQIEKIKEIIINFSTSRWIEKRFNYYNRCQEMMIDASENLHSDIEKDLQKILLKYKKKYPIIEITIPLDRVFMSITNELSQIIKDLESPLETLSRILPNSNKINHRPTSPSYDKLLVNLKEALIDEKGFYIPKMIYVLKSLQNDHLDALSGFEINPESVRVKLSKLKNPSPK